jgi:hypothetical protein
VVASVGDDRGRGSGGDQSAALAAATEELYRVFSGYRLKPHLDACPHCVDDHDHARIHARPLRELSAEDLARYAGKAMSTWGDVNDFRHFLPRLLELGLTTGSDWVYVELVLGKLAYASWRTWPKQEQAAVESFLWLRWNAGLTAAPSEFDTDMWLRALGGVGVDVLPCIGDWRRSAQPAAFAHLVDFLESNPDLVPRGKLGNPYWVDDQAKDACAREMRDWLRGCLDDPAFQTRLAEWYGKR